jgi:hypothetical protein
MAVRKLDSSTDRKAPNCLGLEHSANTAFEVIGLGTKNIKRMVGSGTSLF